MPSEENSTSNVLRQFFVNYLGNRKTLETKIYSSADEIIRDAFSVYDKAEFNNGNAVVTYFDFRGEEKLLENVPEYAELFIRHVRPNSPSFFLFVFQRFLFSSDSSVVFDVRQFVRNSRCSTRFRMSRKNLWRTILLQLCFVDATECQRTSFHLFKLSKKYQSKRKYFPRETHRLAQHDEILRNRKFQQISR